MRGLALQAWIHSILKLNLVPRPYPPHCFTTITNYHIMPIVCFPAEEKSNRISDSGPFTARIISQYLTLLLQCPACCLTAYFVVTSPFKRILAKFSGSTGGPSSSCEMIILHNNSHGGMDLFTIPSPILDMQPHTCESEAGADSC